MSMYDALDFAALFERYTKEEIYEIRQCKLDIAIPLFDKKRSSFATDDYTVRWITNMARTIGKMRNEKSQSDTKKPANRATRWVDYDVRTKEQKNAVREFAKDVDTILDTIVLLLDEGYDLVCKRANEGSAIRTMLFCNIPNHPHDGYALSAIAPDAWLSIAALVYKHAIGLQGVWSTAVSDDDSGDVW